MFPCLSKPSGSESQQKLRKAPKKLTERDLGVGLGLQDTLNSVKKETSHVLDDEARGVSVQGLRVVDLSKTYSTGDCCIAKGVINAVNSIFLEVSNNELLCLLGHNGAGKSTLFNMLTGMLAPSSGYAKIAGFNILDQQTQIRRIMGVVPQFDILWEQMTAMDHMRLFSRIKGVPKHLIEQDSINILERLDLAEVKDAQVCSFSGGMKRRLTVAMSTIGDPSILFLDEPTTGMDPVSRKHVWRLLQDLKKDKTIVLTTHAMEEADALADRIAVVVDGSLKCIGTPINLKNAFGDGYNVNIIC